jgi:hypothetical protein
MHSLVSPHKIIAEMFIMQSRPKFIRPGFVTWSCCWTLSSGWNPTSQRTRKPWKPSVAHTNGRQLSAVWRRPRRPTPFPLTGFDCIWQGRPMIILKLLPKFQAGICFSWWVAGASSSNALGHFLLCAGLQLLRSPLHQKTSQQPDRKFVWSFLVAWHLESQKCRSSKFWIRQF